MWDYHTGDLLRTVLLTSPAISLALDPCDRAFYAGHEDGSIQAFNFFGDSTSVRDPIHDPKNRSNATQASPSELWAVPSLNLGAVHCLDVAYEGTYVFSGHASGKVCLWDVASGKFVRELADYGMPVTNLRALPVTGFPNASVPRLKAHQVVKPRYDPSFSTGSEPSNGMAPTSYTLTAQFTGNLPQPDPERGSSMQLLEAALTQASFPPSFLANSLAELTAFTSSQAKAGRNGDTEANGAEPEHVKNKVADLELQLDKLRASNKQAMKKMVEMRMDKIQSEKEERERTRRRKQEIHCGKRKRRGEGDGESSLNEDSSEEPEHGQDSDSSRLVNSRSGDREGPRSDAVALENGRREQGR